MQGIHKTKIFDFSTRHMMRVVGNDVPDDLAGMYTMAIFTRKRAPSSINQLPVRVQAIIREHLLDNVVTEVYIVSSADNYTLYLRWCVTWCVVRDGNICTCDGLEYERLENRREDLLADSRHARAIYCKNISDKYLSTCVIPSGMTGDLAKIIARYIKAVLSAEGRSRPLPAAHFIFSA